MDTITPFRIPTRAALLGAAFMALMLAGCGDPPAGESGDEQSGGGAPATLVEVTVDDGAGTTQSFSLECGDAPAFTGEAGERDAAAACAALEQAHDRLVTLSDPEREPEMCTEIYGGPEKATIRGTVGGDEVDVEIARNNGCGISDWDALEPLLGSAQGAAEPVS